MAHELDLLADVIDGRLHVAIVRKKRLENLYVDPRVRPVSWASVYQGRVVKVDKRLDAAFVDLGSGETGFLQAKHIVRQTKAQAAAKGIEALLKPGQVLQVQVKAEGRMESAHEYAKLPRLTTKLYTFGQHLLHSPVSTKIAVSKRIKNPAMGQYLQKLRGRGGWIVQPSANDASEEDILFEAEKLVEEWQEIESHSRMIGDVPGLLKQGPNALVRALCDYGVRAFSHIYAGNKDILDDIVLWCAHHEPALVRSKRLRLFKPESKSDRLFDMYDVYGHLSGLSGARVDLACGGWLIMEQTQALMVIDINQGSAATVGDVNREAAREIVRHMRLRSMCGAILIDFINMHKRAERFHLVEAMQTELDGDYGSAAVHGFTRLGIVEVTRKRRVATLAETLSR